MADKLARPVVPGEVWIHISNIKNPKGDVWMVQWCRPDGTHLAVDVKRVAIAGFVGSVWRGTKAQQPRAYLIVDNGHVEVDGKECARVNSLPRNS